MKRAKVVLASGDPAVYALVEAETYPSLGFFGVAPMPDAECLERLVASLESDGPLEAHDRYFAAKYLRMLASNAKALNALRPGKRGRRAGRAKNIALHYVVRSRLSSPKLASEAVAKIWGVEPQSVQDSDDLDWARKEVVTLIKMRRAAPNQQPDGSLKRWTKRAVLKALDAELMERAKRR